MPINGTAETITHKHVKLTTIRELFLRQKNAR